MTILTRLGVVAYMLALTLGLLAGQWPLQGPQLLGARSHGVHLGDLVVLAATAVACFAVLRPERHGRA